MEPKQMHSDSICSNESLGGSDKVWSVREILGGGERKYQCVVRVRLVVSDTKNALS
jgi:hypothetical protein